jgi:hypothetical protein
MQSPLLLGYVARESNRPHGLGCESKNAKQISVLLAAAGNFWH